MSNKIKRWLKIIVSVVVILIVINIMQCANARTTWESEESWEGCIENINEVGACCVRMKGELQVITPDGEEGAVKVVFFPEHFKHKICAAINGIKGA